MSQNGPAGKEPSPDEAGTQSPAPARRRILDHSLVRGALGLAVLGVILGGLLAIDQLNSGGNSALGALDGQRPDVGEQAPAFALRDTEGKVHTLSDYEGQVVWVNFWATWCGPCRRELPDIQRLADEFAGQGLVVLAVNQEESAGKALGFWEELDLRLPILLDSDADVSAQYRLRGLPDNFFIDRDGTLRAFDMGFLTEDQMRERLAEVGLN
jgi:peroxiredoxin